MSFDRKGVRPKWETYSKLQPPERRGYRNEMLLYSAIPNLSPDDVLYYVIQGLFRRFVAKEFQLHPDCLVHSEYEDIVRDRITEMVAKVQRLGFQELNGTLEKLNERRYAVIEQAHHACTHHCRQLGVH